MRIVDYSHGHTGSAHDSLAFEGTAAFKYPEWLFEGEEFAWCDSAYALTNRTISIHKKPASDIPENAMFDGAVSHLRVRSEHCIGAVKGRFQSLRGLRVSICNNREHMLACRWITVAIILHNLIIDVEGGRSGALFGGAHSAADEEADSGAVDGEDEESDSGVVKRRRLVAEIVAYRSVNQQ